MASVGACQIMLSTSYVSGIQAAGDGGVRGALDDGAAVGEESQLVGFTPEFQNEVIVPDSAVRSQAQLHFREVDRAVAFVNLDGVPAAQGDVRAAFASEMDEVVFAAGSATGPRLGGGNFGALVR